MREARLTKNQKKEHKELEAAIEHIKKGAREKSKGVSHKYIKIATRELQQLYKTPRFRNNHNFLLRRYIKLEKKNAIWTNLIIPGLFAFLPSFYIAIFKGTIETATTLLNASAFVDVMSPLLHILYVLCFAGLAFEAIFVIWSIFHIVRGTFCSLARNAESTVKENELCIIGKLLHSYKIILNDEGCTQDKAN